MQRSAKPDLYLVASNAKYKHVAAVGTHSNTPVAALCLKYLFDLHEKKKGAKKKKDTSSTALVRDE